MRSRARRGNKWRKEDLERWRKRRWGWGKSLTAAARTAVKKPMEQVLMLQQYCVFFDAVGLQVGRLGSRCPPAHVKATRAAHQSHTHPRYQDAALGAIRAPEWDVGVPSTYRPFGPPDVRKRPVRRPSTAAISAAPSGILHWNNGPQPNAAHRPRGGRLVQPPVWRRL